jgi:hypothetical protein
MVTSMSQNKLPNHGTTICKTMSYIVMLALSFKTTYIVMLAFMKFISNHTCYGDKRDKTRSYIVMLALKSLRPDHT